MACTLDMIEQMTPSDFTPAGTMIIHNDCATQKLYMQALDLSGMCFTELGDNIYIIYSTYKDIDSVYSISTPCL